MRTLTAIFSAALMTSVLSAPAFAGGASTTRIETRPYYGAVVTLESGVRVFRPLPPTKRVIINPNGDTPLALSFNETEINKRSYNYNYNYHEGRHGSHYGRGAFYGNFAHGRRGFRGGKRGGSVGGGVR